MKVNGNSSERGQAIVLVMLGFVVLLGFAALAVDGSMVYSDRRYTQNAADAASLAGGSDAAIILENEYVNFGNWDQCNNPDIDTAMQEAVDGAIARAADNSYIIHEDASLEYSYERGVLEGAANAECFDIPADEDSFPDRYIDVRTRITSQTDTAFAHFIFGGQMLNTVDAVTRVRPRMPYVYGNAIVALNPAGCSGQQNGAGFHGNAGTIVHGGGVYSNGCLRGDGGTTIFVEDGQVGYGEEWNGNGSFDPAPLPAPHLPPDAYQLEQEPNCTGNTHTAAQFLAASSGDGIDGETEGRLWCVTGDLRINAQDTSTTHGVTIVMVDGELRINGGAVVNWSAPPDFPDPTPGIAGLVLYAPLTNPGPIELTGGAGTDFTGTVLAPGADINVLGNQEFNAIHAQIIGLNVEIGGTAAVNVWFNPDDNPSRPTYLELAR